MICKRTSKRTRLRQSYVCSHAYLREKLLDAAWSREIEVVLVWRLDRLGRSLADLVATLQELSNLGVGFGFYCEVCWDGPEAAIES